MHIAQYIVIPFAAVVFVYKRRFERFDLDNDKISFAFRCRHLAVRIYIILFDEIRADGMRRYVFECTDLRKAEQDAQRAGNGCCQAAVPAGEKLPAALVRIFLRKHGNIVLQKQQRKERGKKGHYAHAERLYVHHRVTVAHAVHQVIEQLLRFLVGEHQACVCTRKEYQKRKRKQSGMQNEFELCCFQLLFEGSLFPFRSGGA